MLMLTLSIKANTLYATLKGKLTEKEVRDFHFYFKPFMQSKEVKEVICNCKGLKKMDYLGRLAMLKLKLDLKSEKKGLSLSEVSNELRKKFIGYRMRIL